MLGFIFDSCRRTSELIAIKKYAHTGLPELLRWTEPLDSLSNEGFFVAREVYRVQALCLAANLV
jgi:hypothetical protein